MPRSGHWQAACGFACLLCCPRQCRHSRPDGLHRARPFNGPASSQGQCPHLPRRSLCEGLATQTIGLSARASASIRSNAASRATIRSIDSMDRVADVVAVWKNSIRLFSPEFPFVSWHMAASSNGAPCCRIALRLIDGCGRRLRLSRFTSSSSPGRVTIQRG